MKALLFAAVILGIVLAAIGGTLAVFYARTNNGPAHVCGLSIVQRSPVAIAMLGVPIRQQGLTMGHEQWLTGGLIRRPRHNENVTFWVAGPKGSAAVRAFSKRSPFESRLTVMLVSNTNESSSIIYDGPIVCPEWHGDVTR
ncbi:MAG TPA: cytochrome c oxidase assembly factor Coa1 family protein [Candidatus Cybelea sp.]|nr:cytochrome c oxidase assembly factor Coa1 family protein [Candidatus Cybelea sp.]